MKFIKGRGCAYILHNKRGRIVILISGLILALVCVVALFIYPTVKFLYLIEKISVPVGTGSIKGFELDEKSSSKFIKELKDVARLLQNLSEPQRCLTIKTYNAYINMNPDSDRYIDQVLKLYLLQRLVFDVPISYPLHHAKAFVSWIGYVGTGLGDQYNLLWPFQYENGQLALVILPLGIRSYYNGAGEYDYFVTRFPLRPPEELK